MTRLLTPTIEYVVEYPGALAFLERQMKIFWFPDEVHVEKDVQDILVNLTESEKHGVITTLKLFTQYELIVGDEYWNKVGQLMQKPACIGRMANAFSFFELNVHAPFYSKINESLGIATKEFYSSYREDPVLKSRIDMLERYADLVKDDPTEKDVALFLAMLALIEGVVLYSSFSFLKHFQSQGKNKVLNIVRGINFSARDEGLHSEASAWLYRTMLGEVEGITEELVDSVHEMADMVREHEYHIIDMIFEKGPIDGITPLQLKHFVDSRVNLVMRNLGYDNVLEVKYNPVGDWFYKGLNDYIANDFFSGQGREYSRDWSEGELSW